MWLKFHEYIKQYGPIVQLNIMGQSHILLGSERVVDDLVRSRGAFYNSRPQSTACSILTNDLHLLLMPQGPGLRERRGILGQVLTRSATSQYEPYQWLESYRMVQDLVREPSDYHDIFDHWSIAMGSRMLYGRAMPTRDGAQKEIMDVTKMAEDTVQPGAYMVDVMPWLRFLPDAIAPWKRYLKKMSRRDEAFYYKMWNATREDLDSGRDVPSWARLCMEDLRVEKSKATLTEHEAVHLVGVTYTAFGTSSKSLEDFVFAMTRHPEWYAKVTEEMDKVVGERRLPSLDDLPKLPILRAVIAETARVWPVTPGGVPHLLTKDDVYEGYHLPAGSIIHLVTWACGREPSLYPEPETFNPDRWLKPEYPTYKEPLTEFPTIQNTMLFGAGRRQCPGMYVGIRNVYIQVLLLVWTCDIKRALDLHGKEIIPPIYDFVSGFNVHPKPFKFELKARSQERMAMVNENYKKALAADAMRE